MGILRNIKDLSKVNNKNFHKKIFYIEIIYICIKYIK